MQSDTDLIMDLVEAATACDECALTVWEFDFIESVSENTQLTERQRETVRTIMEKLDK